MNEWKISTRIAIFLFGIGCLMYIVPVLNKISPILWLLSLLIILVRLGIWLYKILFIEE